MIKEPYKACIELWREVFGDSEQFISQFMQHHYNESNMLYIEKDGKFLSMLHLLIFKHNSYKVGYIYAVATSPKARNKGYATQLIHQAIEMAEKQGLSAIYLIPAKESLYKYYERFGFQGSRKIEFHTNDGFDFGTGEKDSDYASLLLLSPHYMITENILLEK